jgi:hypothetical protein
VWVHFSCKEEIERDNSHFTPPRKENFTFLLHLLLKKGGERERENGSWKKVDDDADEDITLIQN